MCVNQRQRRKEHFTLQGGTSSHVFQMSFKVPPLVAAAALAAAAAVAGLQALPCSDRRP